MKDLYVMSYEGYFFVVDSSAVTCFDEHCLRHEGCELFDSLDDLYEAHMAKFGLERDEVEGNEITLKLIDDKPYEVDGRGCVTIVTEPFDYSFITEYEL